jgi:3-oxoacyl-[acyl-carrier protein] reductase
MRKLMLEDKVIVVSGATRGLGLVMARAFVKHGAFVVLTGSRESAALEAVSLEFGDRAICVEANAIDPNSAVNVVNMTLKKWGKIDVLVNNAGLGMRRISETFNTVPTKFWEAEVDAWQDIINTNINGPYYLSRSVVPCMIEQKGGKIINISTSTQTMVRQGYSPYGPSKAFLEAASRSWAQELSDSGVTVNVLLPGGATDTDLLPPSKNKKGADGNLLSPSVMINPALWLASDGSDGITGARFIARHWDDSDPLQARDDAIQQPKIM